MENGQNYGVKYILAIILYPPVQLDRVKEGVQYFASIIFWTPLGIKEQWGGGGSRFNILRSKLVVPHLRRKLETNNNNSN